MDNKRKENYIGVIHKSTLKVLLEDIVKDHYGKGEDSLVKALYRNISSLGTPGKAALYPSGTRQFYSKHACMDAPYDEGQELLILEG